MGAINGISGFNYYTNYPGIYSNPSDAAIAEKTSAQVRGIDQGTENLKDAQSVTRIADGAMEEVTEYLQRIRELALKSMNDAVYGADEKRMMQDEIDQLKQGIADIAGNTTFNEHQLLDGTKEGDFEIMAGGKGPTERVTPGNMTLESLGIKDFDVTKSFNLKDIDNALKKIVEVCKENGYNVTKDMLWGESAGGHLSTMYCYKYKKTSPVNIGLCYSICGPTDLTDNWYFTTCEIKGREMATLQKLLTSADITLDNYTGEAAIEARKSVSPLYYVTPDSVPTLYYSGGKDPLVQTSDGEKLAAALKKNGVDHYYMEFPNSPHCGRVKDDYGYCKLFDLHLESMLKKYVKR